MTRTRAAATAGHDSSTLTNTTQHGVKISSTSKPRHSAGPVTVTDLDDIRPTKTTTMASARKGKGRPSGSAGIASTSSTADAETSAVPTSTPSLPPPATSKGTRPARSSSRRHAGGAPHPKDAAADQAMEEDIPAAAIQLHDVPDNVMQAQGLSSISTSLIDSLPERSFPKKGISLHPGDQNDPLLILCGKVLASVSNRALTPKEIALILARRHGWQFA